jgi:hypothetical protein
MLIATSIILTTRFNVVITVKLVSINNNRDADESKNKGLLIMLGHSIKTSLCMTSTITYQLIKVLTPQNQTSIFAELIQCRLSPNELLSQSFAALEHFRHLVLGSLISASEVSLVLKIG